MAATLATTSTLLAACGGDEGPPTLTWYINPDVTNTEAFTPEGDPGGQAWIALQCAKQSQGAYDIEVQLLPVDATAQREQLVRRLAANDSGIDLMSLDPPFTAEFAEAGFLAEISEQDATTFTDGVLEGAVEQATWEDQLVAAPFWANTQLLWYRKSVVEEAGLDMQQPVTWDQIIDAANQTKTTVEVQANLYEGYSVWINALVAGAGGTLVENAEAGSEAEIALDSEAGRQAAGIIEKLSSSQAADPGLSTAQETEALAGFTRPNGGFLVNWPYTYADPGLAPIIKDVGWTRYPQSTEGQESAPPLGGINLGIGAFSEHQDLALDAAKCITSEEMQKAYMLQAGNPAAREAVYDDPEVRKAYPTADTIRTSIEDAAPRVPTPYWGDVSLALQKSFHPPSSVDTQTAEEAAQYIADVLQGEALL